MAQEAEAGKLLLADDERSIRRVLGLSLQDRGYEVLTAEDGYSAYEAYRAHDPDIVLADIKMPGMDGIELLKRIKRESPDTEVIMITGHGDMELAIQSLKHEACDFVTKPIKEDVLDIALGRAEEKLSMRRQLRGYTERLEEMVREQSAKLVEAEKLAAAGQVLDRLTTALNGLADDLENGESPFFQEIPCLISLHDSELRVVRTNQPFRERFGDRLGDASWAIYGKGAAGDTDCPAKRCLRTGQPEKSREFATDAHGGIVPLLVHTVPIQDTGGRVDMVMEVGVDLTRVQNLQQELFSTQRRYQQLFDEVPCYITVQDRDLRIRAMNRQFKQEFGDEPGEACYSVYKHRSEPCPECPVLKTFEDGRSHQYETVVTAGSGEQRNVLIWTAPLRDSEGEVAQVMEMSTNITEIRRLQDHLTNLGMLLSSVSHNIKNLFTALDGAMYKVSSGLAKKDGAKVEQGWHRVSHLVGRIKGMVVDILDYAKQREPKRRSVGAGELHVRLVELIEPKAAGYGIRLEQAPPEEDLAIFADTDQIQNALHNILDNAVEACLADPGKDRGDHVIRLEFRAESEEWAVCVVEDNGVGMDRETREKMFTLFFSTKGNRGTGLGMFIAGQTVERHGGRIQVESEPGRGSRVTVWLPRAGSVSQ
jgi:signal transduction histidine kinase/FixJ family two-component response regulator